MVTTPGVCCSGGGAVDVWVMCDWLPSRGDMWLVMMVNTLGARVSAVSR